MGRDLLYKPQAIQLPDEETEGKAKTKKEDKAKRTTTKAPSKGRGIRDLGGVGKSILKKMAEGAATEKSGAHKHAYFNNDISGVRQANFAQSNMKALRGNKEATDLRQVVIPGAHGVDHPEPEVLRGALDLMTGDGGFDPDMASLLNRQGAWAQGEGVTVEMLKARMEQLERMVADRKAALGRMASSTKKTTMTSTTLSHATEVAGSGLNDIDDVVAAGTELAQRTADQAGGMHARLAKLFGLKFEA